MFKSEVVSFDSYCPDTHTPDWLLNLNHWSAKQAIMTQLASNVGERSSLVNKRSRASKKRQLGASPNSGEWPCPLYITPVELEKPLAIVPIIWRGRRWYRHVIRKERNDHRREFISFRCHRGDTLDFFTFMSPVVRWSWITVPLGYTGALIGCSSCTP